MNLPEVRQAGDPVLRIKCHPVTAFDESLTVLVRQMFTVMRLAYPGLRGVGLAANQIGDIRRVIVVDPSGRGIDMRVLVNPVITKADGEQTVNDACFSVGKGRTKGRTKRAKRIKVEFQDETGAPHKLKAQGFFAHVLQHEIDHLDGILFIDKLVGAKPTPWPEAKRTQA